MGIPVNSTCLECNFRRNVELARSLGKEEAVTAFAKALMQLYIDMPENASTVRISPEINELFCRFFGTEQDRYRQEKADSNAFVLERLPQIQALAESAEDPILAGLQLAILGNYLDFSALQGQIRFDQLDQMLRDALQMELDPEMLSRFKADLSVARTLLYVTDNAGEIGFDRIFAQQIQKVYPHLAITFCVRGGPALNDATREDAALMGIPFPVIDNGTRIPGSELSLMSPEAKAAFETADVILSKGMANVETLYGCNLNVYYAFLVKCRRFVELFGKPLMTPMFVREKP
jgi:uncharacterized protein with ATP-grasp and redox domains